MVHEGLRESSFLAEPPGRRVEAGRRSPGSGLGRYMRQEGHGLQRYFEISSDKPARWTNDLLSNEPLDAAETSRFFITANGDDSGGASASSSSDSVSFLMASPTGEARRAVGLLARATLGPSRTHARRGALEALEQSAKIATQKRPTAPVGLARALPLHAPAAPILGRRRAPTAPR